MENTTMNSDLHHILEPLERVQPKKRAALGLRSSAVLIPIVERSRKQLIYTLRANHLKHHAGQISFPGGRIESDETPWEAAVREAEEEIGMNPAGIRRMARLDDVFSPRGFHVQCYVGLVNHPFEPKINHNEVERLISVNIDELLDDDRHEIKMWKGIRKVHYFHFDEGLVWGVTGQITWCLREALRGNPT